MDAPALTAEAIDPALLAEAAEGAMSVKQAAAFTGDSERYLWALMSRGVLRWYYEGRDRRITRASLVRYIAAKLAAHESGAAPKRGRPGKRTRTT